MGARGAVVKDRHGTDIGHGVAAQGASRATVTDGAGDGDVSFGPLNAVGGSDYE